MAKYFFTGAISSEWTRLTYNSTFDIVLVSNFGPNQTTVTGAIPSPTDDVEIAPNNLGGTASVLLEVGAYDRKVTPTNIHDLIIDAGMSLTVSLAGKLGVGGKITNNGSLNVNFQSFVDVAGDITNNGLMTFGDGQSVGNYGLHLTVGTHILSGTGNLRLGPAVAVPVAQTGITGDSFAGLAVLENNSKISGSGTIGSRQGAGFGGFVVLHNQGVVDANDPISMIVLNPEVSQAANPITNSGVLEATSTGGLQIDNARVVQSAGGVIGAYGAGSVVWLDSVTLQGGLIDGSGGGVVRTGNNSPSSNGLVGDVFDGRSVAAGGNGQIGITSTGILEIPQFSIPVSAMGTIDNHGQILIKGFSSMNLHVDAEGLTLTGGGHVKLQGTDGRATLTGFDTTTYSVLHNVDNVIEGSGIIGTNTNSTNHLLQIDNQAQGKIVATSIANPLTMTTGATIANAGLLQADAGLLIVNDAVAGTGSASIANGGTIRFTAAFNQNVSFVGASVETLLVSNAYGGTLSGLSVGDKIDLSYLNFSALYTGTFTANGGGGAYAVTLNGVAQATLNVAGTFTAGSFTLSDDGTGHTLVTVAQAAPTTPDLTVTAPVLGATTVAPGGTTSVNYTVQNIGTALAGASTSKVYLSTDNVITSGDILLGTVTDAAIAAGGSIADTFTATIPGNTTAGTYFIGVISDSGSVVTESLETNNTSSTQITIGTAASVDLQFTSVTAAITTVAAGAATGITYILKNAGTAAAAASTTKVYLSTDNVITSADTLIDTFTDNALAPGASVTNTVLETIPAGLAAGSYFIGMITDTANVVTESNETNNTASVAITVSAQPIVVTKPDLSITAITPGATSIALGGTTSLAYTIKNTGAGAAGTSTSKIYLSTDNQITSADTLLGSVNDDALAAGASLTDNASITLPGTVAPGTYYLGVITDSGNSVSETNEGNNTAATQINVRGTGIDLTAGAIGVNGTNVIQGDSIHVVYTVQNVGTQSAAASGSKVYLSTDATITTSDLLLATTSDPALAAGASAVNDLNVITPGSVALGVYFIGVIADADNAVTESLETNNTTSAVQVILGTSGNEIFNGTTGNDLEFGFGGNDLLNAGVGNDILSGGSGVDVVKFTGLMAQYQIAVANGVITTVDSQAGRDGTDTITSVETLRFSDIGLVFDLSSTIEKTVYLIYQAAFARTPDEGGLRFWASAATTSNIPNLTLADAFIGSAEFSQKYGANPTNLQYVTALYSNVLGRQPDQGGLNFWTDLVNSGVEPRNKLLVDFALSGENATLTAPHLATGWWVA